MKHTTARHTTATMSQAPETARITSQIVALESNRKVLAGVYPAGYATEFFCTRPAWFGRSENEPMEAPDAARAIREYAESVGEPLVDVMVEMADAYLTIQGIPWRDPADREPAIDRARARLAAEGWL